MNQDKQRQVTRSSTAHSRELGEELRRARHNAEESSTGAVEAMQWSLGKLSKLESGSRGTSVWDIGALLGHYGTDKRTRERIIAIATEVDTASFLRLHHGSPDTLAALSAHEPTARTVTAYEPVTVLAQTEDYARALMLVRWTEAYERFVA